MKKLTSLATMVLALAMSASAQKMIDFTHLTATATPQAIPVGYDQPIQGFRWNGIDYVSVPLYEQWLRSQLPALAEADWHDHIDDAHADLFGVDLHANAFVGMQRRELVERHLVDEQIRVLIVDRFDAQQREIALVLFRWADLPRDRRTCL